MSNVLLAFIGTLAEQSPHCSTLTSIRKGVYLPFYVDSVEFIVIMDIDKYVESLKD